MSPGHNLGLLMRLLIGAGTPKEAVARGWYFFVLLRTTDGATYAAILEVFVENSAGPALIVFTTGCDHRLDGITTSSTGCYGLRPAGQPGEPLAAHDPQHGQLAHREPTRQAERHGFGAQFGW